MTGRPDTAARVRSWVYGEVGRFVDVLPDRLHLDPALGTPDEEEPGPFVWTREAIADLCRAFDEQPRPVVEAEQVRLFVNAPDGIAAPPYASWYLDGRLLGPASDWAAENYREQALELAGGARQPPDFLATELEFMYFLCRHEEAARLTADADALAAAREAQWRFFDEHLGRWLPAFARDVRAAAAGPVFARVGDLLDAFCIEERGYLVARRAHGSGLSLRPPSARS